MLPGIEALRSVIDDPAKTTLVITGGAILSFAGIHELMPADGQNLVKTLAVADFLLNAATWQIIRKNQSMSAV